MTTTASIDSELKVAQLGDAKSRGGSSTPFPRQALELTHVFHPSDFTKGNHPAFVHALKIALAAKAKLQLLHVKKTNEELRWSDFPRVRTTLIQWGLLPEGAEGADVARLGLGVSKSEREGRPAQKIADYILDHTPELAVLATHQRHGLDRVLHQSVAEPVARKGRTMTLFVPRTIRGFVDETTGQVQLRNILIPIDRSPHPQIAVNAAAHLARMLGCTDTHFVLLYVGPNEDTPAIHVPSGLAWTHEIRAWNGNVVDNILATAETDKADLIVMATRGHDSFLDALRGSTTERVLRGAKSPLLAVPAE